MTGIIVELIVSWLLLWWFERSNLSVLGLLPHRATIIRTCVGFLIAAAIFIIHELAAGWSAGNHWRLNTSYNLHAAATGVWWVLRSVLFEELIFRGALLYIAIKKLGAQKACLLFAAAFGVYHWFTYGAFGNPVQMVFVFIMTATAGWMFAFAFAKTRSLYVPAAIHLGWNLLSTVMFSKGPLGHQLLIAAGTNKPQGVLSLVLFIFHLFALPVCIWIYLRKQQTAFVIADDKRVV